MHISKPETPKSMKFKSRFQSSAIRMAAMLLLFVFTAAIVSSCKSRQKCAAYGEYRKFKVEQGY